MAGNAKVRVAGSLSEALAGSESVVSSRTNVRLESRPDLTEGIIQRQERGISILSPRDGRPIRRLLYVNSYGGAEVLGKVWSNEMGSQHLWGCVELVRLGYEVAICEPLAYFRAGRKSWRHDLNLFSFARDWLHRDDLLYAGHTVLYWLPLLKALGGLRCVLVSQCFGKERLDFAGSHDGVIALTPAAAEEARKLAPKAKVAHLGWGVDLSFYPTLAYRPQTFLSCGIANRNFETIAAAARLCGQPVTVICPGLLKGIEWPSNVRVLDGGAGWHVSKTKAFTAQQLFHDFYASATGVLTILKTDSRQMTANGLTNVLEAMALGRPIIVTRTGALPEEIDVEKTGCGLFVPPEDPKALAEAMERLAKDPARAREMGETGRRLCESHYNMNRYSRDLHAFFESL